MKEEHDVWAIREKKPGDNWEVISDAEREVITNWLQEYFTNGGQHTVDKLCDSLESTADMFASGDDEGRKTQAVLIQRAISRINEIINNKGELAEGSGVDPVLNHATELIISDMVIDEQSPGPEGKSLTA
tara:strand:+ start:2917 stop:3306 length:390 start_codon:yes stop_codon:yes gene_type:complete